MAIFEPIANTDPRRLLLKSPVTLEPIDEITCATPAQVDAAVAAARAAQPAWAALSFAQRATYFQRALKILLARQDDYIDVFLRESGKATTDALMIEIWAACDSLAFFSGKAKKYLRPQKLKLHGMLRMLKKATIEYVPRGVVGVISPWNGPFILTLNPSVQAMMAGNTVVAKPSEVTPRSGALVADLFAAAGLPAGVFNLVVGDGATGAALVESGVDKISFTGSVATGRKVAEACARRLVPCTLELGGKDAMVVLDDADLDAAAMAACAGGLINTGQYCSGTERIYVTAGAYDAFVEKTTAIVRSLRQDTRGEYDVGSLAWDRQLRIIEQQVDQALAAGARVLVGGKRNPDLKGLYYLPTVIVDVTHDMALMRDETFGPVLPIVKVADVDAAIAMANDCRYGLGATVWSKDIAKAKAVARRLQAGSVCINDLSMTYGALEAPFGGVKESGIGVVNGAEGLRGYCHAKPIIVDRWGGAATKGHYPYQAKKEDGLKKFMRFLWGNPLGALFR